MRIVVDTTVLISAALSRFGMPAQIMSLWEQEAFEVIASEPIFAEYRRVFHYPHLFFSPNTITKSLRHLRHTARLMEHVKEFPVVAADQHVDKFLACAVVGYASYIVSGDEHLLSLKEYRGIPILSSALFVATIREPEL